MNRYHFTGSIPETRYSQPPCSAALLLPEIASEPAWLLYWDWSTKVRGAVSARALQVVQPAGDPFEPATKADSCTCRGAAAATTLARKDRSDGLIRLV